MIRLTLKTCLTIVNYKSTYINPHPRSCLYCVDLIFDLHTGKLSWFNDIFKHIDGLFFKQTKINPTYKHLDVVMILNYTLFI